MLFNRFAFEESLHESRRWLRNVEMNKIRTPRFVRTPIVQDRPVIRKEYELDGKSVLVEVGLGVAALGLAGILLDEDE